MRRASLALLLLACGGAPIEPVEPVSPVRNETTRSDEKRAPKLHARTLSPLPPDVSPDRLGTPASSLAAKPQRARGGYAPQLEPILAFEPPYDMATLVQDPCAVWKAAPPAAPPKGPIRGGDMLACMVVTDRTEQKFAFNASLTSTTKADVSVTATLVPPPAKTQRKPKEKPAVTLDVSGRGPDDTGRACFTLPVVELEGGWTIDVHAKDRGVFTTDADYGSVLLPFNPNQIIAGQNASFAVECRIVPRQAVERQIAIGLVALDRAIDFIDQHLMFEIEAVSWGRLTLISAHPPLDWTAAWSGWDDPRLRARIERLVALERRLDVEMQDALAKMAWPPGMTAFAAEGVALEASFLSCGDKKYEGVRGKKDAWTRGRLADLACVLGVRVRNDKDKPLDLGVYQTLNGIDVRLLDAHGRTYTLGLVGTLKDGVAIPLDQREEPRADPGQTVELLFDVRTKQLLPNTQYAPPDPPLETDPHALEPLVLNVWAPKRDVYGPAPQRARMRVPLR